MKMPGRRSSAHPGKRHMTMTDIPATADGRKSELKFRPLADIFPLMEGEEFDALVADIKAYGLREPIIVYGGKILDGRNRYLACRAAGVDPTFCEYLTVAAVSCSEMIHPADYVMSANIHRRHLTAEQKRELIARLLKERPETSDRVIAKTAKVSPTTVAKVRGTTVQPGQLEEKRVGADCKARKQPALNKRRERIKKLRHLQTTASEKEQQRKHRHAQWEEYDKQATAEAGRLAARIIALDVDSARELNRFLQEGGESRFMEALDDALSARPVAAARADDGLDIPEYLHREPKAVTS